MVPMLKLDATGRPLALNRLRRQFKPYWLLTDSPNNSVTIPANSVVGPIPMTVSGIGPGQAVSFAHEKTGVCLVLLEVDDGQTVLPLMNSPVHVNTLFGTGLNPYHLPSSIVVSENQPIRATFTDISGSANAIRPCFRVNRYTQPIPDPNYSRSDELERIKQRISACFWYTFQGGRVVLAGSAATEVAINIDKERHFQLFTIAGTSTGAYTIDIRDGQTGDSIFNIPDGQNYELANVLVVGTASFPLRFRSPKFFSKNNKIIVRLTDTSAAPNTIYLALGGRFITAKL